MLSQFVIDNVENYKYGKHIIREKGEFIQRTFEVSPAVVCVSVNTVEEIVKYLLERWEVPVEYSRIKQYILEVSTKGIDFKTIKGSEYSAQDYRKVKQAFDHYSYERTSFAVTRRQYSYSFGPKLCMHSIQFFEDYKHAILEFRSCDYIKKFPFDLLLISSMCEAYKLDIEKLYCFIGSLHYYDADTWKLN